MKLYATFIRSKVARRIFLMFILCALFPVAALAFISFLHVNQQLKEQSQRQLREASKAQGMSIFERLYFLQEEMKLSAFNLRAAPATTAAATPEVFLEDLKQRFKGLELVTNEGRHVPLFGRVRTPPELSAGEKEYLASGKTVLSSASCPDLVSCIWMSRELDPEQPARGILVGEVNPAYLWDVDRLPAQMELCVLDQSNRVLFCSTATPPSFSKDLLREIARSPAGQLQWRRGNKEYLADYWAIYLKPVFFIPRWTVILSKARADVFAPLAHFKTIFPLVILLAFWVVLLLSLIQIRRSLGPLEKLREGTQRIADRDFQTRVMVSSGDEFQELATSFNTMASRLGRQFDSLTTINEIDRAILSSWDTGKIVDTVLTRLRDLLPYQGVSISLLDSSAPYTALTYISAADAESEKQIETTTLMPEEVEDLRNHRETLAIDTAEKLPHYLAPLAKHGMKSFLVLPIFLDEDLSAIISLGHPASPARTQEDILQARQVADQVAVALSNARLIAELNQLQWGTLKALARAIDAKSAWTSGHSERVTNLAVKIGRAMALPPKELTILHRGGLLHDVGKIGTPAEILDKAGKLNEEELRVMREHVRIGARILEPIPGFAECIPIVLQHHEWFDGSGYPDGLAGGAISLHARIFAVADCYDALASDRPYRPGWDRDRVVHYIMEKAGKQFDPRVVEAFLDVVAQENKGSECEATCAPPVGAS